MAVGSTTKVPTWVFWAAPLALALVVIAAFIVFLLLPPDLGNYRVGDVYSTATPTSVVTVAKAPQRYVVATLGTILPGYEALEYSLGTGTQLQITRIRDANDVWRDSQRLPPDVVARVLNGPHGGETVILTPISALRDVGSQHPKADPSPTYLTLVTQGSGK